MSTLIAITLFGILAGISVYHLYSDNRRKIESLDKRLAELEEVAKIRPCLVPHQLGNRLPALLGR